MIKPSPSSLRCLSIVCAFVLGLLTACSDRETPKAGLSTAENRGPNPSSTTQCFYAVGEMNKKDAELFAASEAGDLVRVNQSIDDGGNVNAIDPLKRTPLFASAFCNHPEVTSLLIAKGSDVNAKDFLGMSPLHAAVVVGWDEETKLLLLKGANINLQDADGHTPLHIAAATDQMSMVDLLLERGVNAQVRDKHGITAARSASNNGHKAIAEKIKSAIGKQRLSNAK